MIGAIPKILIGIILLSTCVLGGRDFTKTGTRGEIRPWKLPQFTPKNDRIVNGVRASDNYRKGTAQVMYFDNEPQFLGFYGLCTGSIVGKRYVLSAAHCFSDDNGGVIGEDWAEFGVIPATKFSSQQEAKKHGIRVKTIYMHKKYDPLTLAYDVAVLELEADIPDNRYKQVTLANPPKDKSNVKAVGYGATNDARVPTSRLLMTNVVYRKYNWCVRREPYPSGVSRKYSLCAVSVGWPSGNTDSCYGDSGGPLYKIRKDDKLMQIGITSFSNSGCAAYEGIPWYAHVGKLRKPIKKLISKGNSAGFDAFRYSNSESGF